MEISPTYIHHIKPPRNWGDAPNAFYSVTLHTKNKHPYFSATQMNEIAHRFWAEIPAYFPFVELDVFSFAPNQANGILFLNRPKYESWRTNFFKPQSENLASVVKHYKDRVKKYALSNSLEFDWQPKYKEHVIQSETELSTVRQYITRILIENMKD